VEVQLDVPDEIQIVYTGLDFSHFLLTAFWHCEKLTIGLLEDSGACTLLTNLPEIRLRKQTLPFRFRTAAQAQTRLNIEG
jgi:hypothetical protein